MARSTRGSPRAGSATQPNSASPGRRSHRSNTGSLPDYEFFEREEAAAEEAQRLAAQQAREAQGLHFPEGADRTDREQELQSELEDCNEHGRQLQARLHTSHQEIGRLRELLLEARDHIAVAADQYDEDQEEIGRLLEQNIDYQENFGDLNAAVRDADGDADEIDRLRQEIARLREEEERQDGIIQQSIEDLDELLDLNRGLTEQLARCQAHGRELQRQIDDLIQAGRQETIRFHDIVDRTREAWEEARLAHERQLDELRNQIDDVAHEGVQPLLRRLRQQLEKCEEHGRRLQEECDRLRDERDELRAEARVIQNLVDRERQRAQRDYNEIVDERDNTGRLYRHLAAQYDDAVDAIRARLAPDIDDELIDDPQELQRRVEHAMATIVRLQLDLADCKWHRRQLEGGGDSDDEGGPDDEEGGSEEGSEDEVPEEGSEDRTGLVPVVSRTEYTQAATQTATASPQRAMTRSRAATKNAPLESMSFESKKRKRGEN